MVYGNMQHAACRGVPHCADGAFTINVGQFRKTGRRRRTGMAMCSGIAEVHQQQPQVSHEDLKDGLGGMELVRFAEVRIQLQLLRLRGQGLS